jgi:hypothetical protein
MLKLAVRSPEELVNHNIVAVGYPALDPRNDVPLQNEIFGNVYYVKRLQPGVLRARQRIQSFENQVACAGCSTTMRRRPLSGSIPEFSGAARSRPPQSC